MKNKSSKTLLHYREKVNCIVKEAFVFYVRSIPSLCINQQIYIFCTHSTALGCPQLLNHCRVPLTPNRHRTALSLCSPYSHLKIITALPHKQSIKQDYITFQVKNFLFLFQWWIDLVFSAFFVH